MDNVRYNISPCTSNEIKAFIASIDKDIYIPRGVVSADEKSHYDRYSFTRADSRVAIVYDTFANVVSITGRVEFADDLLKLFAPSSDKSVKRSVVPAQGCVPPVQDRNDRYNGEFAEFGKSDNRYYRSDNRYGNAYDTSNKSPVEENSGDSGLRSKLFVSPEMLKNRRQPTGYSALATSRGHEISTDEIYPPQMARKRTDNRYNNANDPISARGSFFMIANARGQEISTDEIYPPQIAKKKPQQNVDGDFVYRSDADRERRVPQSDASYVGSGAVNDGELKKAFDGGLNISANVKKTDRPRRAVISFGADDDDFKYKSNTKINTRGTSTVNTVRETPDQFTCDNRVDMQTENAEFKASDRSAATAFVPDNNVIEPVKRKRGRPPKNAQSAIANVIVSGDETVGDANAEKNNVPEYKNGYSVKNYPQSALTGLLKRLKSFDRIKVSADGTEFTDTPQEVKSYLVTDNAGQKVILRYATNKMTLQLQGKRSDLFGEVQSQISQDSDYSSALEGYVEADRTGAAPQTKVTDVQNRLKKRLPTAYGYLSEQSRIDFSYGIHDFGQAALRLSDYSVLLVPPFRGLERFVFDLQRSEGIKVKMIGQAFDKDDRGNYILKSGYQQRINSVIYCEVMVSLYNEYFSRRNFFAHSDNTDENVSRAIPDRNAAKHIFDHLLDVLEYNAKKLKEIGYTIKNTK